MRNSALKLFPAGTILFGFGCGGGDVTTPTSGSIEIATVTSGPEPDTDGYSITFDGGTETAIGSNATLRHDNLDPGNHSVLLSAIAGNCTVASDNPRAVMVTAGEGTSVTFTVSCVTPPATTGSLLITTVTAGPSPDPDGYAATVDGGTPLFIEINGTRTLPALAVGSRTVSLDGLAANCAVQGANPQQVTIIESQQVSVTFTVSCPTPVLRWEFMESGTQQHLWGVWVNPAGEAAAGYALGRNNTFLRLEGSKWSRQSFGGDWFVNDVWGRSAAEAFAVGWTYTDPQHDFSRGVILHYRNGAWSEVPAVPVPRVQRCWSLDVLWGTEADLFAIGSACREGGDRRTEGPGVVAHYDGVSWSMTVQGSLLADVSGTSARDVYVVDQAPDIFDHESDNILHYDGVSWSKVLSSEAGSDGDPSTDQLESDFVRVWAASPTSVFVLGVENPPGDAPDHQSFILRYDGNSWSEVFRSELFLSDIWSSSPTDVYVLGGSSQGGVILHYDGATWSRQPTPMGKFLSAIWGRSATDLYAVGNDGTILHGTP